MKSAARAAAALPKPFSPAFTRADKRRRVVVVPTMSRSFSAMSSAVFRKLGYRSMPLPLADQHAQHLGKRYVHNDACFPAQINIGECLRFLSTGAAAPGDVALVLAKNCEDCRAGQYFALARKALDDAGYGEVALLTTGSDGKRIHPGFTPGLRFKLSMLWGIALTDALDAMVRATRPYELSPGSVDRLYEEHLAKICRALERGSIKARAAFLRAVKAFNAVPADRGRKRPRVLVIGEILMNYHEAANRQVVRYLEKNGMEVLLPDIVSFFWRQVVVDRDMVRRGLARRPALKFVEAAAFDTAYRHVLGRVERIYKRFRFYEPRPTVSELASCVAGFVDTAIVAGEGWLIPAEIMHYAKKGVTSFVIIQPFGCLPNQITGRGIVKPLKERFPHINILALDYDFDVSMANLENRLQMLVMAAKQYT
jgi:predicted nucleotide-binding protein (sugar kinase/HSP70/actin superfamily)